MTTPYTSKPRPPHSSGCTVPCTLSLTVLGTAQMSILEHLPFSLCQAGPEQIDGVGNFCLQILAPAPSQCVLSTLYFLDSHSQITSEKHNPDYDPIKQSQIEWFLKASRARQNVFDNSHNHFHMSIVFLHIPLPEFGDCHLSIRNGRRREPTESPSFNSHFYDALVSRGVSALGCGHDHVNDFCALLPRKQQDGNESRSGPWLCYGGGSGFGGYCSYGKQRFHRRMRVWELDTNVGLKTWKRVEYATNKVDELNLVERGVVIDTSGEEYGDRRCVFC